MLELKLDQATVFDCQRHSQDSNGVLHYSALLDFIDLRRRLSMKGEPRAETGAQVLWCTKWLHVALGRGKA